MVVEGALKLARNHSPRKTRVFYLPAQRQVKAGA
jgi:hypothetical protein